MTAGSDYLLWQRRTGLVAMTLLALALLSQADALVGGLAGNRGLIELLPGTSFAISGPMPPRTETIDEFVIDGEPADGSVRLVPRAIFAGFWFGGAMWRGAIEVAADAREGSHLLTVHDRYGEKQNPALIFQVRVWPDLAARNAHSPSRLTRLTGQSPYAFALAFAILGLFAGAANFLCGRLWTRHLHIHRCSEIHRARVSDQGPEVACELPPAVDARPDRVCALYRPGGKPLGTARVAGFEGKDVLLLVDPSSSEVRPGDVVCFADEEAGPTIRPAKGSSP
jgi:hypothetical protein